MLKFYTCNDGFVRVSPSDFLNELHKVLGVAISNIKTYEVDGNLSNNVFQFVHVFCG